MNSALLMDPFNKILQTTAMHQEQTFIKNKKQCHVKSNGVPSGRRQPYKLQPVGSQLVFYSQNKVL